jgi:nucleoid-associated protein YgaU
VAELQAHLKQQQLAAEEALLRADKAEKLHAALEESNARLRTENERLSMELATARERQAEAMQRVLELDTRLEATAARAGVAAPVSDGPPAAAGASPQPAVASATKVVYEVREEDTLSRIAAKVYGDASAWGRIFDANRDVLDGPDDLALGMRLIIP